VTAAKMCPDNASGRGPHPRDATGPD
jgi:hypothetical protein